MQNGQQIQYDNEGNMLFVYSDGKKTEFTYDLHNKLVGVGDTEYIYNAQDVRIKKREADSTTEYIYDTNAAFQNYL